jgi:site-specific recombinase XerD
MFQSRKRNLKWCDINMGDFELEKLVMHFAQSNRAEGKSPKTIAWYSDMIYGFIRFLADTGRGSVLANFDITIVREFIIHEQERGLSAFSVQDKVRALRAFASWLYRENYTTDQVLYNLKMPKAPKYLIEPLTNAEIDQLIKSQNPLTGLGCRNIAILVLLLDTGLRISELSGLRSDNADIEDGYLKVMGKGSKERLIPIGGLAQKMLWRYTIHFRPNPLLQTGDYLFLTPDGNPLRPNAIKLLLRRWGKKAGVPRLHAHLCRHSYATNYLNYNCGDVFRLQQILGHSTLEMVRRYVHFASAQAMVNNKPSSPVDQMGISRLNGSKLDRMLKQNHGTTLIKQPH